MGNPQLEDGFTRIANELLEALCNIRIPGEARQIFDLIMRKTYGFNKKEDRIPLSQFAQFTGIKKPNVKRAINKLIKMNLVIKKDKNKAAIYSINKHYLSWKPLSKKITGEKAEEIKSEDSEGKYIQKDIPVVNLDKSLIENDKISLSEVIPSKDSTKENISKETDPKEKDVARILKGTIFEPLSEDKKLFFDDEEGLVTNYGIDVLKSAVKNKNSLHNSDNKLKPRNLKELEISLIIACELEQKE